MVTNAEVPEQSPGNREKAVDAAYTVRDTLATGIRYAVAGDPRGRIRRGVLYLVAVGSFVLAAPLPGLLALGMLMLTDAVVEA